MNNQIYWICFRNIMNWYDNKINEIYIKKCKIHKIINNMHGEHKRMISIFRKRLKHKYIITKIQIEENFIQDPHNQICKKKTLSYIATENAQKLILYKARCAYKIKLQLQNIKLIDNEVEFIEYKFNEFLNELNKWSNELQYFKNMQNKNREIFRNI